MQNGSTTRKYLSSYTWLYVMYLSAYAIVISFATVYLLAKGFASSTIGVILAVGTILAVVSQQPVAAFADRTTRIELNRLTGMISAVPVPLAVLLLFCHFSSLWVAGLLFLVIYAVTFILQSMINALGMQFVNRGVAINYGFSRGISCLVYAALASGAGKLAEQAGVDILMVLAIAFFLLLAGILVSFRMPPAKTVAQRTGESPKGSFLAFARRYPQLMVLIFSLVLAYFGYFYFSIYLVNVLAPLGGGSAEVGMTYAFMSLMEFVPLILYSTLARHFKVETLMRWCVLLIPVKGVAICAAPSVLFVYLAQLLHMGGCGLFMAAAVYYINEAVCPEDRVQGQALIMGAGMVGNVFASLLGGWGIEVLGVTPTGWIINAVAVSGGILGFLMVGKISLWGSLTEKMERQPQEAAAV